MNTPAAHRLTNGDLYDMDAYDRREHLVHYVAAHGWDDYALTVAASTATMIAVPGDEIVRDINQDLEVIAP
jgi:hypothetical protein